MPDHEARVRFAAWVATRTDAEHQERIMPTVAKVRPCAKIEPDGAEQSDLLTSMVDRYRALTTELPLAGGPALKPDADGAPALIIRLREEAPWLQPAIELLDFQLRLQIWAGRPWVAFRPLLLVGPSGCGKSTLARLLARHSGCGHAILDLGGVSDARSLEGTARGWTNAQPCFPAVVMNQSKTANPVITLEEIDKAGGSLRNGDPKAVFLTMSERSTAERYYDKCLLAQVDLSHVNWVATANTIERLSPMLLSRMDVVEVAGPGPEHFDQLVRNIRRDLAARWQVPFSDLPELHARAEKLARDLFARGRSVRKLAVAVERAVGASVSAKQRQVH